MRFAGIVTIFLGLFIVFSRGPLLVFPAATLHWFGAVIKSEARTRVMGTIVTPIALLMIWAGMSQRTGLESALFIFGMFFLVVAISALLLFPKVYMNLACSFLPDDLTGSLFGWRLIGLLGVVIGIAILLVGIDAL